MSRPITQPINQVKLTNVAVVRMNKGGKRFEIACYRNKVVNYRQGLETDLSEVLQTERVFTNVSKGQFAKISDLEKVFATRKETDICRIILESGTVQVGDLERAEQLKNVQREIETWIANHCVHSRTQRPFTVTQIGQAMQESNFVVHNPSTRPLKRQFLDCIKSLQSVLELERAKMEIVLLVPRRHREQIQRQLQEWNIAVPLAAAADSSEIVDNNQYDDDPTTIIALGSHDTHLKFNILVDPSLYRQLDELAKSLEGCQLQIIQQVVMNQDAVDLEVQVEQRHNNNRPLSPATEQFSVVAAAASPQSAKMNDDLLNSDASKLSIHRGSSKFEVPAVDDDDDDDDDDKSPCFHNNKQQRQTQKKSKKAKRREKEDILERQTRIDVERQRREEREQLSGTSSSAAQHRLEDASTAADSTSAASAAKSCNTCGGSFVTPADYRAHFRGDWHRFNQKLKLQGKPPIPEQEFLLCDADMLLLND